MTWLAVDMYDRERWSVVCPEHEARSLWVHRVVEAFEATRSGLRLEDVVPDATSAVVAHACDQLQKCHRIGRGVRGR